MNIYKSLAKTEYIGQVHITIDFICNRLVEFWGMQS